MSYTSENDRRIYEEELAPRLPQRIFDAHVHIWDRDSYPPGKLFPPRSFQNHTGGTFTLAQWREAMHELLPRQETWLNCFGNPDADSDRALVPAADRRREFAMVLVSPADPADIVQERISRSRAVGLKPYLNYAADVLRKPPSEVEVDDMLTPAQLRLADDRGLAITLHIPRPGRFADPLNQRQMLALCEAYPHAKFIFAHLGRAYFLRNIQRSNLAEFACLPNAYFDTAMVNSPDILRYAFDHFPADRILFGTDTPIALLRGKSIEVNHQYAYLMGEDYAIGTSIVDTGHALQFTTFLYEQLRAILDAAPDGMLEAILFQNAHTLFASIP